MTRARPAAAVTMSILAVAVVLACGSNGTAPVSIATVPPTEAISSATGAPSASSASATPEADRASAPQPITIAAVGDLMLARDVAAQMAAAGPLYPFERAMPLFAGADLLIGNLEGTFTDRGTPLDKQYTFRTPPALAEGLALAGFDAVSLANNHSFDFGAIGFADTIEALDAVSVRSVGAGADEAAAHAPAIFEVAGQTVALLGFNAIGETSVATADRAGAGAADDDALTAVAAASASANYVLVMIHAGVEYSHAPSESQASFARAVIDAGADVVIGHHPHALQPWEAYGDGLILHSLGNFVFDLDAGDLASLGTTPFESVVAMITLAPDARPRVVARPATIDVAENRPRPATADEVPAILERIGSGWEWELVAAPAGRAPEHIEVGAPFPVLIAGRAAAIDQRLAMTR